GSVEEVFPGLQLPGDLGLVVDEARGSPRLDDRVVVVRVPVPPEERRVDVLQVGDELQVELGEQAVLHHLRDEWAGRDDNVVAAGAAGGDELRDHLFVRVERVEGDLGAQLGGEVGQHFRVVVVTPGVDGEVVLKGASGGTGCRL